jgi:hypothetical protein
MVSLGPDLRVIQHHFMNTSSLKKARELSRHGGRDRNFYFEILELSGKSLELDKHVAGKGRLYYYKIRGHLHRPVNR